MCKRQNNSPNADKDEYSGEISFFGVARASLYCFYEQKLTKPLQIAFYILIIAILYLLGSLLISCINTREILEKIVGTTIGLTATMLGFLITGFSIYSALFDKNLIYLMMNYKKTGESKSQLHITNLYFYEPFVFFGVTLVLSVLAYVALLLWPSYYSNIQDFKYWIISCKILLAVYLISIFICGISLKDFIFNVYSVALTAAQFEEIRRSIKNENDEYDQIIERLNQRKQQG